MHRIVGRLTNLIHSASNNCSCTISHRSSCNQSTSTCFRSFSKGPHKNAACRGCSTYNCPLETFCNDCSNTQSFTRFNLFVGFNTCTNHSPNNTAYSNLA